jgi:hypothetical protein
MFLGCSLVGEEKLVDRNNNFPGRFFRYLKYSKASRGAPIRWPKEKLSD